MRQSDTSNSQDTSRAVEDRQDDGDAHRRRQAALLAFGRRVASQPPLPRLFEDALALAGEVLGVDWGYHGLVANGKIEAEILAVGGQQDSPARPPGRIEWPLNASSMASRVFRSTEILTIPDLHTERRFIDLRLRELGLAAWLIAPLYLNARPYGVIGLCCRQPHRWSQDDISFMETMVHMLTAGAAIAARGQMARDQGDMPAENRLGVPDKPGGKASAGARLQGPDGPGPAPSGAERRSSPRRDYPVAQKIAFCTAGSAPAPGSFFPVLCKDISATGIAFLLDRAPESETVVVDLGREPRITKVVCRIVRVLPTDVGGRRKYLVGCRFIGRFA
jgi:hypothetical protein